MDHGTIVERGTHAELLRRMASTPALWARQREAEEARRKLAEMVEEGALMEDDTEFDPDPAPSLLPVP